MSIAHEANTSAELVPNHTVETASSVRGSWLQVGRISRYEWTCTTLQISELAPPLNGLRILQLSDLHFRSMWFPGYDQIIGRVRDHPPDLILITGDFVEARADHRPALSMLERFLKSLHARLGIFGILGNHDGDLLAPRLAAMGVTLINGHTARLESRNATIELVGVPGITRGDLTDEFIAFVGPRRTGSARIVLSHYPDAIHRIAPLRADVVFSGHTHGGQICLPNGFAPLTHDRLPRRMAKGVHRVGESWLVVSKGLGFATWRVRAFCPAEVVEIVLERNGG